MWVSVKLFPLQQGKEEGGVRRQGETERHELTDTHAHTHREMSEFKKDERDRERGRERERKR